MEKSDLNINNYPFVYGESLESEPSGLPIELMYYIGTYLDPSDILNAGATCKSWKQIFENETVWTEVIERSGIFIHTGENPKQMFIMMHKTKKYRELLSERAEITRQSKAGLLSKAKAFVTWNKHPDVVREEKIAVIDNQLEGFDEMHQTGEDVIKAVIGSKYYDSLPDISELRADEYEFWGLGSPSLIECLSGILKGFESKKHPIVKGTMSFTSKTLKTWNQRFILVQYSIEDYPGDESYFERYPVTALIYQKHNSKEWVVDVSRSSNFFGYYFSDTEKDFEQTSSQKKRARRLQELIHKGKVTLEHPRGFCGSETVTHTLHLGYSMIKSDKKVEHAYPFDFGI